MKARVGKRVFHLADKLSSNAALEKPQREVDQIAASEDLDKRAALASTNAMVQVDDRRHFGVPALAGRTSKIVVREFDRRRKIIPCIGRPDAQVVKASGDDDLLLLFGVQLALGETEIHHAVYMIPVSR